MPELRRKRVKRAEIGKDVDLFSFLEAVRADDRGGGIVAIFIYAVIGLALAWQLIS